MNPSSEATNDQVDETILKSHSEDAASCSIESSYYEEEILSECEEITLEEEVFQQLIKMGIIDQEHQEDQNVAYVDLSKLTTSSPRKIETPSRKRRPGRRRYNRNDAVIENAQLLQNNQPEKLFTKADSCCSSVTWFEGSQIEEISVSSQEDEQQTDISRSFGS